MRFTFLIFVCLAIAAAYVYADVHVHVRSQSQTQTEEAEVVMVEPSGVVPIIGSTGSLLLHTPTIITPDGQNAVPIPIPIPVPVPNAAVHTPVILTDAAPPGKLYFYFDFDLFFFCFLNHSYNTESVYIFYIELLFFLFFFDFVFFFFCYLIQNNINFHMCFFHCQVIHHQWLLILLFLHK
jgi:hypothetical protein